MKQYIILEPTCGPSAYTAMMYMMAFTDCMVEMSKSTADPLGSS